MAKFTLQRFPLCSFSLYVTVDWGLISRVWFLELTQHMPLGIFVCISYFSLEGFFSFMFFFFFLITFILILFLLNEHVVLPIICCLFYTEGCLKWFILAKFIWLWFYFFLEPFVYSFERQAFIWTILWQNVQIKAFLASRVAQMVKNLPAMRETWVQSWVGKIPWRRESYPLQDSGLENLMDRGAWRVTVQGVAKSWTRLSG